MIKNKIDYLFIVTILIEIKIPKSNIAPIYLIRVNMTKVYSFWIIEFFRRNNAVTIYLNQV